MVVEVFRSLKEIIPYCKNMLWQVLQENNVTQMKAFKYNHENVLISMKVKASMEKDIRIIKNKLK